MKITSLFKNIFTVVGLGMLVGALFSFENTQELLKDSLTVDGTVVELVRTESSDMGATYRPVVEFETRSGSLITFTSSFSSKPPRYSQGELVKVLYQVSFPEQAKINSFFSTWVGPIIFASIGSVFFIFVILIMLLESLMGRAKFIPFDGGAPNALEELERNEMKIKKSKFKLIVANILIVFGSLIFFTSLFEENIFILVMSSMIVVTGVLIRLGKVKGKNIENIIKNRIELELIDTDDPIASKIKWTPVIAGSGSKYRASALQEIDYNRIKIKPSKFTCLFSGLFFVLGLLLVLGGFFGANISLIVIGFIFEVGMLKFFSADFKDIYIDKIENLIYEKKYFIFKKFDSSPLLSEYTNNVHALQIIEKYLRSSGTNGQRSGYWCFELNLILKDFRRVCIMNHGDHLILIEDAKKLSTFLNIPIWDAT
jgi:hypothetical protein